MTDKKVLRMDDEFGDCIIMAVLFIDEGDLPDRLEMIGDRVSRGHYPRGENR
jgi:hypothetical protein